MKQKELKYTKTDERRLEKSIKDFNKRVDRLRNTRKDTSYLPQEISFTKTKRLIKTKDELERVIKRLDRFKGREAYKKVTLKGGEEITAWEKAELLKEKQVAIKRLNKRLKELKRPEYKMGTEEYREVKNVLESVKNFQQLKGTAFETAMARIENYGSKDYEMRQAITYRKNYMIMLRKEYKNFDNYLKLVRGLNKIENPIDFYEFIKKSKYGENVKNIRYMYDTQDGEDYLQALYEELIQKFK